MAQYCELAGKVTNCTDNCKICLEEERRDNKVENNFKVGDIVRYLKDTSNYDESEKNLLSARWNSWNYCFDGRRRHSGSVAERNNVGRRLLVRRTRRH